MLQRRPKRRNPNLRADQIMVRMSATEKASLLRYCMQQDITVSAGVRFFVTKGLREAFPEETPIGHTQDTRLVNSNA